MPDVLLQQPPRFTYSGADTLGKLRTAVIEKFNISNDQLPLSFYRISEQTAQMVKSNPHEGIGYAPASILQLFGTPERCGEGSGDQTLIDAQLDEGLTYLAVDTTPSKLINPSDDSNRAQPSSSTDTQNLPEAHFGSTASVPFSFGDNKFVNSLGPAPSQEKKLYPPRRIDVTTIPLGSKQTTGRDLMEPGTRMTRSTSQQAVDRAKGLCGSVLIHRITSRPFLISLYRLSNLGNTCVGIALDSADFR